MRIPAADSLVKMSGIGLLAAALAVGAAAVALASMSGGGGDPPEPPQTAGADDSSRTALTITLRTSGRAEPRQRSYSLRCGPSGGTWRRAASVCRRLKGEKGTRALSRIGPETRDLVPITSTPVTVRGRADGRRVNVEIPARGSSTRRKRFQLLRNVLGPRTFDRAATRLRR